MAINKPTSPKGVVKQETQETPNEDISSLEGEGTPEMVEQTSVTEQEKHVPSAPYLESEGELRHNSASRIPSNWIIIPIAGSSICEASCSYMPGYIFRGTPKEFSKMLTA